MQWLPGVTCETTGLLQIEPVGPPRLGQRAAVARRFVQRQVDREGVDAWLPRDSGVRRDAQGLITPRGLAMRRVPPVAAYA